MRTSTTAASKPPFVDPIFFYGHGSFDGEGCAVVGAAFYNPASPRFPRAFVGNYFFADFCNGWIRRLGTNNLPMAFVTGAGNPIALEIGPAAALYCLSLKNGTEAVVYRISYEGGARIQWVKRGADGRFHLYVAPASSPYVLEASSDLVRWQPVATNSTPSLGLDYYDDQSSVQARRFFRVVASLR